jgi:hypothetical protein
MTVLNDFYISDCPYQSGFQLHLYANGVEAGASADAEAIYDVRYHQFAITGLNFLGANLITTDQYDLSPQGYVYLEAEFSGSQGYNSQGELKANIGLRSVLGANVYTGSYAGFSPDIIDETNLVSSKQLSLSEELTSSLISISEEEIDYKTESIFYKVVPLDTLTLKPPPENIYTSGEMLPATPDDNFTLSGSSTLDIKREDGSDYIYSQDYYSRIYLPQTATITFDGSDIIDDYLQEWEITSDDAKITIRGINGASVNQSLDAGGFSSALNVSETTSNYIVLNTGLRYFSFFTEKKTDGSIRVQGISF